MHAEYVQTHGRAAAGHKPAWLNLTALPEKLRNSSSYRCLSSRGNWQAMYRFGPPVVPYMLFEISVRTKVAIMQTTLKWLLFLTSPLSSRI